MRKDSRPAIFLDANILISAGKPPGGLMISRIAELVKTGLITILTTDLTITEIYKKHTDNDYNIIKEVSRAHFRNTLEKVTSVALPNITKTQIKEKLTTTYRTSTEAMFKKLKAKTLAIDDVKPSVIFADYAAGAGFFTREGKKDQFPDAFIFECLKTEAVKKTIIIVSNDSDYVKPVSNEKNITLATSFLELFKILGLELEPPNLDKFLERHKNELIKAADSELADWGLIADIEDAEIDETSVIDIDIQDVIAFKSTQEGGSILVVGRLAIKATIAYTHPDWDGAAYDSEDKKLIPYEEVSGETEVNLDIDVSMSIAIDEQGEPIEIEDLRFRNRDFQYVELHPHDPYEHM